MPSRGNQERLGSFVVVGIVAWARQQTTMEVGARASTSGASLRNQSDVTPHKFESNGQDESVLGPRPDRLG